MAHQVFNLPPQQPLSAAGRVLPGSKLYFFLTTTSTPTPVYTTSALSVAHTQPLIADAGGRFASVYLVPTITYKATVTDSNDVLLYTVDPVNDQLLSQGVIGSYLYPVSAQETSAGATVVNSNYAYGYWDRYKTNTTPGVTDMAPAASISYAVADEMGCSVRWGATAPYRLASPVDCTGYRGIVSWDESSGKSSSGDPSVIIDHDGQTYSHGFDLSTSTEMVFNDMVPTNGSGKTPNCVFFCARSATPPGSEPGSGQHRFNNIHTPSAASFRHVFYWYGSEENVINDSILYNSRSGSSIVNINATNGSSYTSSFTTIATGAMSNVGHHMVGVHLFNSGNSGSANEVCIALERAGNFNWVNGLAYCPHGLAYISVGGTVGLNFFSLKNIRGETDGAAGSTCGIAVRCTTATGADEIAHWTLDNVAFSTTGAGYLLDFNSTSDIIDLNMRGCYSSSGNLILAHGVRYSNIDHGQQVVTGLAGGVISNNVFRGNRANVTLTAASIPNVYLDMTLGQSGVDGIRFPATQVASANANTLDDYEEGTFTPTIVLGTGSVSAYTTQTGSYTKVGRKVTANLLITVNTVTGGPAGTLKIGALPFTSSSGLKGAVSVAVNTFGAVATPVMGFVDSAATTLSLFTLAAGTLGNPGANVGAGTQIYVTANYEV